MPPAPDVAATVREALRLLRSPDLGAVPRWFSLPAPHIVLKLRSGEASAGFFRDLVAMLDAVVGVCGGGGGGGGKGAQAAAGSLASAAEWRDESKLR